MTVVDPAHTLNGFDYSPGEQADDGQVPEVDRVLGTMFSRFDAMWTVWADGRQQDMGEWEATDMSNMLRRYAQGRSVKNVLTLPLGQLKHKITPAKGDKGEADWVNEFLTRAANQGGMSTPLDLLISQMTSGITYKRAYFEKVFKVAEIGGARSHVYDSVQFRHASTCQLVRNPSTAAFDGFAQEPLTREQQEKTQGLPIKIDPKYAFVYLHGMRDDPINGSSDLEIAYWCYKTQQKVLFLYFNYLEGEALGKTIVEAADLGRAMQIAQEVRKLKGSGVLPVANTAGANQKIYSLEQSNSGAVHFMEAIRYLDHAAAQSVMAGFLDLTDTNTGGRGSHALSESAQDFFLMSRQADANEMAWFIRNYLLCDIVYYRFGLDATVPNFEFEPLAKTDIASAMTLMGQIAAAPNLNLPEEFVRELALLIAGSLGLDVDKLTAAFQDARYKAEREAARKGLPPAGQGAAGMASVTNIAARLVKRGKELSEVL